MNNPTAGNCSVCFVEFPFRKGKKFCSKRCVDKGKPSVLGLSCAKCLRYMVRGSTSHAQGLAVCVACRRDGKQESKSVRQVAYNRARRAKMRELPSEPYTLADVAERAEFRCWLCSEDVDMSLRRPSQWCASVDHVVPISRGGGDLLANVNLAHWICNAARSNREVREVANG